MMTSMQFLEPTTTQEAIALLREHGAAAKLLAGGSAIVLLMQQKLITPDALVSLGQVDGLRGLAVASDGALSIGAMTPLAEVAADARVRQGWPALALACRSVANVRIRNQATLGGNVAEADYASDPPAALVALNASARVRGPSGERLIPLGEFFLGLYTTALDEDELLTDIVVPPQPERAASTYLKYKSRSSEDRPCVGVAAVVVMDNSICRAARVAVGAACDVPQRFPELERQLIGQRLTDGAVTGFAAAYADALSEPLSDLRGSAEYRRAMARAHIRRVLSRLALPDGEAGGAHAERSS